MGNTLEGQKALAPKPKKQKIVVTPDKPYYSSPELESGFKQTLPAATMSAQLREGYFGNLSPRAAALDTVSKGINLSLQNLATSTPVVVVSAFTNIDFVGFFC